MLFVVLTVAGCGTTAPRRVDVPELSTEPRSPALAPRPGAPTLATGTGKQEFTIATTSAVVYVPPSIIRSQPVGLVLFLHGGSRQVEPYIEAHRPIADSTRVIVLAPYAVGSSWDAIRGDFAWDVTVIERALEWVFARWTIDPAKVVVSGFSDGGTYALALGRANGELFKRVAAWSPGFLIDVPEQGKPPILVAHGTQDLVLPFTYTQTTIVPTLEQLGYTVDFREFTGPHAMNLQMVAWLLNDIRSP
jgi:predicted esterase